jgi:hypothetical protein
MELTQGNSFISALNFVTCAKFYSDLSKGAEYIREMSLMPYVKRLLK